MANARKNSIHHQLTVKRTSRSEYNDSLLRHNQRQENRLYKELEQWDKAQRTVAKGLDKESQWFKQTSATISHAHQRHKRNSMTDLSGGGGAGGGEGQSSGPGQTQSRLIPDYQYRNRATFVTYQAGSNQPDSDLEGPHPAPENNNNNKDSESTDLTDSAKPQPKKTSKTWDRQPKSRGSNPSGKPSDDRKSSNGNRKSSGGRGEQDSGETKKRDPDKPGSGNVSSSLSSSKAEKKARKSEVPKQQQRLRWRNLQQQQHHHHHLLLHQQSNTTTNHHHHQQQQEQ
ncbi:uncharacterized protein LOC143276838 [Babylonia areolata]|uniref:uncharacterized protein LOC143276838 n=1 Tax=Babylonia areolata TaxID=304850 RepID=UPI003FD261DF